MIVREKACFSFTPIISIKYELGIKLLSVLYTKLFVSSIASTTPSDIIPKIIPKTVLEVNSWSQTIQNLSTKQKQPIENLTKVTHAS